MITLGDYLIVSAILFAIGFAGVMLRRNLIIILMSLELMLNAANLSLVAFSRFRIGANGLPDYNAEVLVFFVITVAAAEVAVGLALFVALYRARQTTDVDDITSLKFYPANQTDYALLLSVADPVRTFHKRDGHHAIHAAMEIIEWCNFDQRRADKFLLQLLYLRSDSYVSS